MLSTSWKEASYAHLKSFHVSPHPTVIISWQRERGGGGNKQKNPKNNNNLTYTERSRRFPPCGTSVWDLRGGSRERHRRATEPRSRTEAHSRRRVLPKKSVWRMEGAGLGVGRELGRGGRQAEARDKGRERGAGGRRQEGSRNPCERRRRRTAPVRGAIQHTRSPRLCGRAAALSPLSAGCARNARWRGGGAMSSHSLSDWTSRKFLQKSSPKKKKKNVHHQCFLAMRKELYRQESK